MDWFKALPLFCLNKTVCLIFKSCCFTRLFWMVGESVFCSYFILNIIINNPTYFVHEDMNLLKLVLCPEIESLNLSSN